MTLRRIATVFLITAFAVSLAANFVAPYSYATQFRDTPNAAASPQHALGTDALGRDRLSRLLYGARVSLLLAPAAALVSVGLAVLIALLGALTRPWCEQATVAAANLFLSLPWIFLLLAARAVLPLHTGAGTTALVTFGLMGILSWAAPSRVMVAAVRQHLQSDFVLLAQASGCGQKRLALVQLAPNLAPVALAQFLIATPTFLLAEANLGLLGLGIPEPMPSWGSLIRELESLSAISANPWMLAPALLLILVVCAFHLAISADEYVV
jgi:ABC-type dipeptide/oligopeptide/nickel transport system permease subunit